MLKLEELLQQAQSSHYKMLAIVDNSNQAAKVTEHLAPQGWRSYDVEEAVLGILETIPVDRRRVRIGDALKKWFQSLPDKVILYNTNILYSPDLGRLNPIGAFKYKSRDKVIVVLLSGELTGNKICYSTMDRPDYTEMDVSEVVCVRREDIDA